MLYCSPSDVYSHGVPPGAVANPARPPASVDVSTDTFELGDHGLITGGEVSFRAEAGGTTPAPLAANTIYYAIVIDEHRFKVASSLVNAEANTPINLTTTGARLMLVPKLPMSAAIAFASRVIDDKLPAHAVPLEGEPIPEILRITAAELAAGKLGAFSGSTSRTLTSIVDDAHKRIDRWAKGIPLRGPDVPKRLNLAASSVSPTRPLCDSRGWGKYGGF